MSDRLALTSAALVFSLFSLSGCGGPEARGFPDPYRLSEPKRFTAHRASSNNPDWRSNDDSKRPIPGETAVLADLEGPRVVRHI